MYFDLSNAFNNFDNIFSCAGGHAQDMRVDVIEQENGYKFVVDANDITKENIKLNYEQDYFTIEFSREENKEDEKTKYLRRERVYNDVKRSFYVPDIDPDKISAKLNNGVLEIVLEKAVNKQPKQIVIE